MSWREFSYLLVGLNSETPLGRIVNIRSEDDAEVIKEFTIEQKQIRNEYRRKMAKKKPQQEVDSAIESFRQAFIKLAGGADEKT